MTTVDELKESKSKSKLEGGSLNYWMSFCFFSIISLTGGDTLLGLSSLSESVLELSCHGLHVAHASSTGCATSLGFQGPVEMTHLSSRVPARGAHLLSEMVGNISASSARGV